MAGTIEKVSIIISKGSLDGVYPGLIMANGARAEGIEANLFFTFFGLDAIHKARHDHIKMATVGNPGLHFATMLGGLPGMSSVMTHYMSHKMAKLDIPSVPEFIEMIADTGAGLYACKGVGRPVRLGEERLHRPGPGHHHRGRVLRHRRGRADHLHVITTALARLVGDDVTVPCIDGQDRPYLSLDAAASTPSLQTVLDRVQEFVPWYSSVHRGAGRKSQLATAAYEDARAAALRFAGRPGRDDVAIVCRNTTEAINHLAYRLRLDPADVVVTTVVEHHANLLPWARLARRRYVECGTDGTFDAAAVAAALDDGPRPRLLAITGASNVTGWAPPLHEVIDVAHDRGVPVLVDAAQLAPHRPIPGGADFVAWSGHKMYAPFGAGVLVGPRATFTDGDPFLAGGGAVDLVDLDEVVWTDPPDREEAGSPNVIGAVALHAAIDELARIGWDAIGAHDDTLAGRLRAGLASIEGVRLLGVSAAALPVATFVVEGVPHALVAARLSAEYGIGVRHGCFCAHPYLLRLLHLANDEVAAYRDAVRHGDRRRMPGAVRASAGLSTTASDIDRFIEAVRAIATGAPAPVAYDQDTHTGDFWPHTADEPWASEARRLGASCARG
jgi:selenocysteine lyase/cysteine desulfurase/peroxiredoxin family protein